jgi:hypothetical protein
MYVFADFYLDVFCQGDLSCQHGKIVYVYHVPNLSFILLFVASLTQTCKIVEFWLDLVQCLEFEKREVYYH